jgi:hypothetical protein
MVKVAISAPATIPAGIVPGANKLSRAAIEMKPDGTVFSSPVTVTWPYTPLQVDGLIESGLSVYYYQGPDYSSSGISGVSINTSTHVATFTTNHFTTFVLAGPAVDSDGDGIADWWEILWFGNLTTANATSNFDGDAYTDLQEFRLRDLGFNPLVPDSVTLPAGGITALALLGIGLLGVGTRKLRSPR